MSNINTVPSVSSEVLPAVQLEDNLSQPVHAVEPAQSVGLATPLAPVVTELDGLDDAARNEIGNGWADRCQKAGRDFLEIDARRDVYLLRAIASLALSVVFFPGTDWASKVDALRIGSANIKSKRKFAMAVVGAFGLNPYAKDAKEAKFAGQALDFYALATEWLAGHIENMAAGELAMLTLDDAGIAQLCRVLQNEGGLRAVSDLQRAANKEAVTASRLRVSIDKKGAAESITRRGEQRLRVQSSLAGNASVPVVVEVKVGSAQTLYTIPDALLASIRAHVFAAEAGVDPVVDMLGELMLVGAMVPHKVADAASGARGVASEMHVGSRQFVLHADRSVQVSPIAASDVCGPVVVVRPVTSFIEPWSTVPCRLSSEGWQFAEANLIDADRRPYFDATVSAANANGVASIELTTAVTGNEGASSQSIAIEPIASGLAAYPTEFDASSFQSEFVFEVAVSKLKDWVDSLGAKLRVTDAFVKLTADGKVAALKLGKHVLPVTLTGSATVGVVYLRPTDFGAIVKSLAALNQIGTVSFVIDQKAGMRVSFRTALAAYEVYAPVLQLGSFKPYTQSFRPIVVA